MEVRVGVGVGAGVGVGEAEETIKAVGEEEVEEDHTKET